MTLVLEYHKPVRPSISGPVAVFSSLAAALFLALPALAQINGAPASVTSPGFGGRAINGPRASVTSLGPEGTTPVHPPLSGTGKGVHHHPGDGQHQRRNDSNFVGPIWYGVPVPYALDNGSAVDQPQASEDDSDDQGGPAVFDRHGNGERSYVPTVRETGGSRTCPRAG